MQLCDNALVAQEADRYVKKRKAFEERDERAAAVKKVVSCFPDHELDETWLPNDVCVFEQAEDDEVAEEVRGLPLEDRLQVCSHLCILRAGLYFI